MSDTALIKLVHKGMLAAPQTFSFGLWFEVPAPYDGPTMASWLTSVASAFSTYRSATGGLKDMLGSGEAMTELRSYSYAIGSNTPVAVAAQANTLGGAVARVLPYQCAVVHSLRSATPGRGGRGRCYVPLAQNGLMSAGQLTSAGTVSIAAAFAAYITALNATTPGGFPTKVVIANPLASTSAPIVTNVVVDSVVDTQQRRRDKVPIIASTSHTV